nr:MarR family winged helix-turn-helix transcriptional regulator [Rugamonas sp.]
MRSNTINDPLLCNGATLRKATRRVTQLYDTILAPCGLKMSQCSILSSIDRAGSPTMSDLAHTMTLDRSALAHNMKPLERDGYVEQTKNESDGRSRRIRLTAAGQAKLAESNKLWQHAQDRFETVYGHENAERLRASLSIIFSDEFAKLFNAAVR